MDLQTIYYSIKFTQHVNPCSKMQHLGILQLTYYMGNCSAADLTDLCSYMGLLLISAFCGGGLEMLLTRIIDLPKGTQHSDACVQEQSF